MLKHKMNNKRNYIRPVKMGCKLQGHLNCDNIALKLKANLKADDELFFFVKCIFPKLSLTRVRGKKNVKLFEHGPTISLG